MGKIGRNEPCPCGSGEKYKRCGYLETEVHRKNVNAVAHVGELLASGKIPFRAEIESVSGKSSSMTISGASVVDDRGVHQVFSDEIELSVGGDGPAKAVFEVPIQTAKMGQVITTGDAKITNKTEFYNVSIVAARKLKAKSPNGLFATVTTQTQRDIGVDVCHVYFGAEGKEESIGIGGKKDRPHIVFASTGAGLFKRLASYNCSISSRSTYERRSKVLSVSSIRIDIADWNEALEVTFDVDHAKVETRATSIGFVPIAKST